MRRRRCNIRPATPRSVCQSSILRKRLRKDAEGRCGLLRPPLFAGFLSLPERRFSQLSQCPVILPAEASQLDAVREIFREYAAWVGDEICFTSFEIELANLPGRYAPLLLAWEDNQIAACAAL